MLFRDAFELYLNFNPSKAEVLVRHTSSRKRFEAEKFSLDTLVQQGFDLSKKVGTVLVPQQDFSDLPTVKSVYSVLFPSSGELSTCFNERALWMLYQRRHLFVHPRGVVDQAYLDNTGDTVPLGSRLPLTPKGFEADFKLILGAGKALLGCLPTNAGAA